MSVSSCMVKVGALWVTGSLSGAGPVLPELHLQRRISRVEASSWTTLCVSLHKAKLHLKQLCPPKKPAQICSLNQSPLQSFPEHHEPRGLLGSLHPNISIGFLGAGIELARPSEWGLSSCQTLLSSSGAWAPVDVGKALE